MKLYKYRDINDAWPFLDILFSKRLYLAPLDRLNDPMELKQHDARHVIEALGHLEKLLRHLILE
jgi:hypothetical protein